MVKNDYDLSHLGAIPTNESSFDLSYLGATPLSMQSNSSNVDTFLGKMPRRPDIPPFNNTPEAQNKLKSGLQDTLSTAGMAMAPQFALPELLASKLPNAITGVGNYLGRIGMGTGLVGAQSALAPSARENPLEMGQKSISDALPWVTGMETLPLPFKAAGAAIDYLKPQKYADALVKSISGGKGIEEIGQNLAERIKNAYNSVFEQGNKSYDDFLSNNNIKLGGDVYTRRTPIEGISNLGKYEKLEIGKIPDSNINNLHEKFLKNPTFDNAHNLQSELAVEQRYLENLKEKTADQKNWMRQYGKMRSSLQDDMQSYLRKQGGEPLVRQYKDISKYWLNNIVPYKADKKLFNIAKGKEDNPTRESLLSIFKNPNKNMRQVVNHIGNQGKNEISYLGMGLNPDQFTTQNLLSKASALDKSGLGSYKNPELIETLKKLKTRQNVAEGLKTLIGGTLGYGLGSLTGSPELEVLGAIAGGKYAPQFEKVMNLIPSQDMGRNISDFFAKTYRPAGRAIIGYNTENR